MNICLVLISDGWGGAETVVYELTTFLKYKGINVSIILNQEILKFYNFLKGVEIFNIGYVYNYKMLIREIISLKPEIDRKANSSPFPSLIINELLRPIYFKRIGKKIIRFLLSKNIDIIHSHLVNADILISCLKNLKIPWITTVHGHYLSELKKNNSIRSIISFKKRKAKNFKDSLPKMDKVTFVSNWLLDIFNNKLQIEDKSISIYNGIKLSNFQRKLIPTIKLKGKFNLLFPGGAKFFKGGDILIQAIYIIIDKIPDVHLYIALNVPQKHMLRKLVKYLRLENNITFLGFLRKEKYKEFLNSVDVFILPSRIEAFSLANLEAMALGIPIITSNRGGIPELIKNGKNGLIVEPNPDQIANAILCLYKNGYLRKEMRRNNLEKIKKFDLNLINGKYIDVYRKILLEKNTS